MRLTRTSATTKKNHLKILAIGSGIGNYDLTLLSALQGRNLDYTCVEPYAPSLETFQKKISERSFTNLEFGGVIGTYQDFAHTLTSNTYDVIHFMHCLYYIPEHEKVLQECYDALCEGGVLYAVLGNAKSETQNGCREFFKYRPEEEKEMLAYEMEIVEDLELIAQKNGWASQMFVHELNDTTIDVTECFTEPESPGALAMLNFFSHLDLSAYPLSVRNEVAEWLKTKSAQNEEGAFHVTATEAALAITKTSEQAT